MLRRIARDSMDQLAAFLTSPEVACGAAPLPRLARRRLRTPKPPAPAALRDGASIRCGATASAADSVNGLTPALIAPEKSLADNHPRSYCRSGPPCYDHAALRAVRRAEFAMAGKNGAIKLVAGNSNPVPRRGNRRLSRRPADQGLVRRFADMEIFVEIQENVRGEDVFVIQSTRIPANDHLMELLIIIDALRRASARRITAVIPYFGYARQDRKPGPRTPISAKLVANLITHAGADRVMTLDLHAGQIQGFFDIPTDNLYASPVMVRDIKERFDLTNVMVVSPDVGGVVRARGLAKRIDAPLAIVDKRRERPANPK